MNRILAAAAAAIAIALSAPVATPTRADDLDTMLLQSQLDDLQDSMDDLQDSMDEAHDAAIMRYCAHHYCNAPHAVARSNPEPKRDCLFHAITGFVPCLN